MAAPLPYSWKFLTLLSLLAHRVSSDPKYSDWGQACKIRDNSRTEILEPKYACDTGRGLICRASTQGTLCACSGVLTYDRRSQECRRKVSAECDMPKNKVELDRLFFSQKCHEDAECVIYSGTLGPTPVCLCKQGFVSTRDLSECRGPDALGAEAETDRKKGLKTVCKEGFVSTTDLPECHDPNGTTNLRPSLLLFLLNAIGIYFLRSHTQN